MDVKTILYDIQSLPTNSKDCFDIDSISFQCHGHQIDIETAL